MTPREAGLALARLAAEVREADVDEAASRLLQKVAEAGPELKDALVVIGARRVIEEVRP